MNEIIEKMGQQEETIQENDDQMQEMENILKQIE